MQKCGIFGTGPLVRALLPHIKRNFEVVAIWDEDGSELEEEAESLNISIYSSHEDDVLYNKEITLLIILCPPIHHAQIAVKALGIAKNVYVHPPCATDLPQTLRMVSAANYFPNLTAVVGSLRALPAVCEMRHLINQSYLGTDIVHCDVRLNSPSLIGNSRYSWKCSEEMGGGVLNFFGSQLIDLVIYLLGQKAVCVNAVFRTIQKKTPNVAGIRQITADDVASLFIETDSNCLITVNLNAQSSYFSQELTITGTHGILALRNANLFGRKLSTGDSIINHDASEEVFHLDTNNKNHAKIQDDTVSEDDSNSIPQVYLQGYAMVFDQLNAELKSRDKNLSNQDQDKKLATFEDALHISEIFAAARQSFMEKTWTRVGSSSLNGSGGGNGNSGLSVGK